MPTISVVIPTYNRAELLIQALRSVLQQTFQDFEIIIVDDGSTDDTKKRIAFLLADARLKYICQENLGPSAARNAGIRESYGEYISFLDSDDIWAPDKLQKQLGAIRASDEFDVVYCDFFKIDVNGKVLPEQWVRPKSRGTLYEDLMYGNVIAGSDSAVLIRANCFSEVGMFDEELPSYEDQDMWRRISIKYKFLFLNEKLVFVRLHPSHTHIQNDPEQMTIGAMRYLKKIYIDTPEIFRHHLPNVFYNIYLRTISSLLTKNKYYKATLCSVKILSLAPKYWFLFGLYLIRFFFKKIYDHMPKPIQRLYKKFKQRWVRVHLPSGEV